MHRVKNQAGMIKTRWLFVIPFLMFGFGYLMVPLYEVFCDITGLNGKTGQVTQQQANADEVDYSRAVKVEFIYSLNERAPWQITPEKKSMMVHPGQTYQTFYTAKNLTDNQMVAQAVPSVAPAKAAKYFNKTECFCFEKQNFAAHEARDMPLIFIVDSDIPESVETITLSYTFFDASPEAEANVAAYHHEH